MSASGIFVGVDTGGTFTDIVAIGPTGHVIVRKVDNLATDATMSIASGLVALLEQTGLSRSDVSRMVHCTTILGNSVIERRGPNCALLTTSGFRDVLELGRQHNPVLYDIFWKKPEPLIQRDRIFEVDERIAADGSIVRPLDDASLDRAIDRLIDLGIESVAVCLINACTNPAHEEAIAARVVARMPDVTVSISSRISPEWGEYERTSTTATDAFVKPTFARYLSALDRAMADQELRPELFVMQSAGSVASVRQALDAPVLCLDSGPVAAVVAAAELGKALGYGDVLALEIGGTTTKSTLIEGGVPRRATETEINTPVGTDGRLLRGGGYTLRMPVIDAAEVGAGGGSIARVDAGGSLSVGPDGAGAFPGPASYGRGGTLPTVTDANLVLGYLSADRPLGGTLHLKPELAEQAIATHVAEPLGMSVLEAAFAIRSLANAIVARAVRTVSTERGRDARRFTLLAAGGGGPCHAADIARLLGAETVIIPPHAGVFSALGMLWAPPEQRASLAVKLPLDEHSAAHRLASILADRLGSMDRSAFVGDPEILEEVDVRYVGQFHQLTVPVMRRSGAVDLTAIRDGFEAEHERSFGYASAHEKCEIAAVRVRMRHPAAASGTELADIPKAGGAQVERRYLYFGPKLGHQQARVFDRTSVPEERVQGPFVIAEYDTTVIVPPDFTLRREANGVLLLERISEGK